MVLLGGLDLNDWNNKLNKSGIDHGPLVNRQMENYEEQAACSSGTTKSDNTQKKVTKANYILSNQQIADEKISYLFASEI